MLKPEGYDSIEPIILDENYNGEYEKPTLGGHIFRIISAKEAISKAGDPMLVLELDICDGKFTNYYTNWSNRVNSNRYLKVFRRLRNKTPDDKALAFYKGMITAIEHSNPGFKFNFDENLLIDKFVGGKLELNDKGYHTITMLCSIETAKKIEQKECPKQNKDEQNKNIDNIFNISPIEISNTNNVISNIDDVPF